MRAQGELPSGRTANRLCRQLDFRPPLAWDSLLSYLRVRAIPGVECVDDTHYRRTVSTGNVQGWIAVSRAKSGTALLVDVSSSLAPAIGSVLARLRHQFDLDAVPDAVSDLLSQDVLLARVVRELPGLRVPGAFDGFEVAVRAVLGQQISVKAATTMAGRWVQNFGTEIATPFPGLGRLVPTARRMAEIDADEFAATGVIRSRARCITALARAVESSEVSLTPTADVEAQIDGLLRLPGIGPWTAQYIAMRALGWPDAFPAGDLMLSRAAGLGRRELQARAQSWRPWRAYATHYLWQSLTAPAESGAAMLAPCRTKPTSRSMARNSRTPNP